MRDEPEDFGLENDPLSQFEAVNFLVNTENMAINNSERSVLRLASCDGATSLRRAEAHNTMARIR